jgi:hypothetical protein
VQQLQGLRRLALLRLVFCISNALMAHGCSHPSSLLRHLLQRLCQQRLCCGKVGSSGSDHCTAGLLSILLVLRVRGLPAMCHGQAHTSKFGCCTNAAVRLFMTRTGVAQSTTMWMRRTPESAIQDCC